MLIFALPKASTDQMNVIQWNAVQSWKRTSENPRVILMGSDQGIAELARETGVEHVTDIETTAFGTPLISSAFAKAQEYGEDLFVYVNADIILPPDFGRWCKRIRKRRYLLVGGRYDFDQNERLRFGDGDEWYRRLTAKVKATGTAHRRDGIDFFAFSRGVFEEVPPFAAGRPGFDNWLIAHALARNVPVIDCTRCFFGFHQNHDYSHVGGRRQMTDGPEANSNRTIAGSMICDLDDSNYVLSKLGEIPRLGDSVAWQRWCRRKGVRWGPRATPLGVVKLLLKGRFRW